MSTWILLLLLGWQHGEAPSLSEGPDRGLVLRLPGALFEHKDVVKQINSGLTAALVVTVTDREGRIGGARIAVRYEPWDEVYHVQVLDMRGTETKRVLATRTEMADFFKKGVLHVWSAKHRLHRDQPFAIRIKVLPFSQREQADTQAWLTRTVSGQRPGGVPTMGMELILERSIKRPTTTQFEWKVGLKP
ncbi:hypothetical protein SCOR_18555 [Sulfidibacter corallicola]|uniref:Uncharacterized protein n=1 Tax=Sulfidibacter corallicola TaxID=2818388 RepID=A0A8A4TUB6_SULCO|nr:hypothetical protein [Sulfidibacter corallicola]QTD53549.1 hypothetical protein J3U87_13925 [Sulfidibacter corallicola]